ncbi:MULTISPECIES: AAA family ATPase [Corynebacterium]|uniref:AAA family ATPase n=1 Tax=Corynebacterium TaxID=1716 RepID=UPI0025796B3F|nr:MULTISPECIES: AAA family ATPase [Corynebacterium]
MYTVEDPITWNPRRIVVAGASGAGKTTLCGQLERALSLPRVEIDSLYHGAGWTPRANFVAEVEAFSAGQEWVIEWQYRAVRRLLVEGADTLVWLDYSSWLQMTRLVRRTMRRRLARQELWNGNYETIFQDEEHIIRWGIRTFP